MGCCRVEHMQLGEPKRGGTMPAARRVKAVACTVPAPIPLLHTHPMRLLCA